MLQISHLTKSFNNIKAVNDISFTLNTGEVLVVLGPSGCGKSTLLAMIAGLITPDSGDVLWEKKSITGTPTHQRNFGLMFQDYALFPHLNVGDNVGFGLVNTKSSTPNVSTKRNIENILERIGLAGFEKRDVQTLSGGEAQRVALARALAPHPRLLMLDEPLGALDRSLREQLTRELRKILKEFNQTAIYVTHDQQEAFSIADHIAIMQNGSIMQIDAPEEIFKNPKDGFVKEFLGGSVLVEGRVKDQQLKITDWKLEVGNWKLEDGDKVIMLLKAEGIKKK